MASGTIRTVIERIFQNYHPWHNYFTGTDNNTDCLRCIEIPINKHSFEVPLFALDNFIKYIDLASFPSFSEYADSIVAVLRISGRKGPYKTLDANIKSIFESSFDSKLIQIPVDGATYYGTDGAIFDKDLNPLVLLSWKIKRDIVKDEEDKDSFKYSMVKPILRISPTCFNKEDTVQRYISSKLFSAAVGTDFWLDWRRPKWERIQGSFSISVAIEKIPFSLRNTQKPSISTTNEDLYKLILSHLDEFNVWA